MKRERFKPPRGGFRGRDGAREVVAPPGITLNLKWTGCRYDPWPLSVCVLIRLVRESILTPL